MSNDSGLLTVRERQLIEAERQVAALRAQITDLLADLDGTGSMLTQVSREHQALTKALQWIVQAYQVRGGERECEWGPEELAMEMSQHAAMALQAVASVPYHPSQLVEKP